jgi:hypothetical protein
VLLHYPTDLAQTALDTPAGFHATALAADLICMLGAADPGQLFAQLPPTQVRLLCLRHVVAGVQWRRTLIDRIRLGLERGRFYREGGSDLLDGRVLESLASQESRLAAGRLAITLALRVAWYTQRPEIALAYLESVEALRFIHTVLPSESPTLLRFMDVAGETPTQDDYRLLGQLETAQLVKRLAEISPMLVRQQSVLTRADIALSQEHVNAFFTAAADTRQAPMLPGE